MTTDTLRQITGVLRTPEGSAFPNKTLTWFRERRVVQAQGSSVVLDEPFYVVTDASGGIDQDVMAGNYLVLVRLKDTDRYFRVSVPDQAGPFNIADLVDAPPVTPEIITQVQALAIKARAWAQNPEDVEVESGEYSALHHSRKAATSAAQAALYDGPWLDDVAALREDETLTYTTGTASSVAAGDYVRTRAEGFAYQVAAADATDGHVTTTGGVKLNQVGQPQQWNVVGRPAAPTPVVSATAGILNGTYYWTVTFVTAGGETEASNAASASPAINQVNVTIPVSLDSRVIARKLYRTVAGSVEPMQGRLVATINDNTTTTYTDNIADGSLGAPAPHIDTTAGKILNGTEVIGAFSSLGTTFGSRAMPTGQGYASTAIGANALEFSAGGYRNTAVGADALRHNTTGFNNSALGVHALDVNEAGGDNSAFGQGALFNSEGNGNTAVGSNAGLYLLSGDENTYLGFTAGQQKTSGSGNTAVGSRSQRASGSGSYNTSLGFAASQNITEGNFNTTIGYNANAFATTGEYNVALGMEALYQCETGARNVAIGPQAGWWENGSLHLWIDALPRSSLADAKVKALIYGEFGVDRGAQKIDANGQVNFLAGLGMPGRTVTVNGPVTVDDTVLTCDKPGSSLVLTLPIGKADKVLILRNHAAQTVVSADPLVQPVGGGALGTAILPATVGAWAIIRCQDSAFTWEMIMKG